MLLKKESLMKTSKIAGLVIAGTLAVAPAALGEGFGDIKLPSGRSSNAAHITTQKLKDTRSGVAANFYAPLEQSGPRHWSIRMNWQSYPFFVLVNK
jgi:hypothetical protein